ncbi:hypothetical protein PENTCL1PPCAC_6516 [Pristionchus entomophagus]|uniref:Rap-GAP domain-containing protein n=1 Tax=Pristionchus entomophagus TaxID=358040 RepID=A0AAV5SLV3_9BILA|nr:hypothetical protein PENTCL1PPCAC_6516 [Pristionchus entomophagus]
MNGITPEKANCTSIVRGVISAICDHICRPEWNSDFPVSFSALDALNALSTLPHDILFTNKDLSTGMLIVTCLCRLIETQLGKPPPSHSKDLHSSVVAAFQSLTVWFTSSPLLAECESVLHIVADTIQLGITGTKKHGAERGESKAASRRVLDAAEATLHSLFTCLGSHSSRGIVDERRLLHLFGPSAIDTTKFQHFLVNDSILSIHEASHITNLAMGSPCVLYVRRSPMHMARVGCARMRETHQETERERETNNDWNGDGSTKTSVSSINSLSISSPLPSSSLSSPPTKLTEAYAKAQAFRLPSDFNKVTCKVDTQFHSIESSGESEEILLEMQRLSSIEGLRPDSSLARMKMDERIPTPKSPVKACNSIRVFLYDMGLLDEKSYGKDLVALDAGQSCDFYRDLHDAIDCSPSSFISTTHVFYVRNGQRNALDILENGMNLQSLSSEFLILLSSLGEGVEVGRHEGWTGNWSTAYSSDRKPLEGRGGVDHYILDGLSHCLYTKEGGCEMAFVLPSQRAVRHFKMEMPQPRSSRSGKSTLTYSQSEVLSPTRTDLRDNDDVFVQSPTIRSFQPYGGGGSSMGGGNSSTRRSQSDVRIVVIWVERLEDVIHFPLEDLVSTCDDGGDVVSSSSSSLFSPPSTTSSSHSPGAKSNCASIPFIGIFVHEMESGLVQIRTRTNGTRFGSVGPLMDGMVVSVSSLSSLIRLTILNVTRRNIAEVDNYQHMNVKRRQAISEFGKKYALDVPYHQFLTKLILS